MNVLVAGWFSFEGMGATAGDLLSRDVVTSWLVQHGIPHVVATAPPFSGGVDWRGTDANTFSHVLFVCGPFGNGEPLIGFLERFKHCRLVGVNLSMLQSLDEWNPFDLLLERDSSAGVRPDLSFLAPPFRTPVVGLILVHPQTEYGDRGRHGHVNSVVRAMLDSIEAAVVPIDTRLDINATGLRSPAEVEALIAATDVVMTTRLHGMVLALKNGVPPIAVDPIAGGAKITRQAAALGWPLVFQADAATPDALRSAFETALDDQIRNLAIEVAQRAREILASETKLAFDRFIDDQRREGSPG
jgi:hypothetical protein